MFFSTRGRKRTGATRSQQNTAITILELINAIFDKYLEAQKLRLGQQSTLPSNVAEAAYRYMKLKPGCGKKAIKSHYREMLKEIRPDLKYEDIVERRYRENQFLALQNARHILDQLEKDDEQ